MYAKTLTMANSKFVGRVLSYQLDFNPSLTTFYKKILKYSDISIPEEKINELVYTLNPPRTLNNNNLTDLLGTIDGVLTNIIKAMLGENGDAGDEGNFLKDALYKEIFKEFAPNLPWDKYEKLLDESKLNYAKIVAEKKIKGNSDNQSGY